MHLFSIRFFLLMCAGVLCVQFLTACGDERNIESPALTLDSLQGQNENTTGTQEFKVGLETSLDLSGTVDVGAEVEVEVNRDEPVLATVSGGTWSYSLDIASLTEGTNVIAVTAEDSLGNRRSLSFFVTRDTTGPDITFDQFLTPDRDGTQTIGGTVDVGSTVDVFVDGELETETADVKGGIWYHPLNLEDGTYTVSAIGYDEIGNPSPEVDAQIEVDSAAPLLIVDQVSLEWTGVSSMTVSGTRESDSDLTLSPIETTAGIENVDTSNPDSWSADFVDLDPGVNLFSVAVNAGTAEAQVIAFRDLSSPEVIANSPAYGSEAAPPAEVTVTFSEDMDAESIELTNVAAAESPSMTLVDSAGALVNGNIIYDSGSRKAVYTPDSLVTGEQYTVTVKSTVRDARGNALGSGYSWTFETE
ncbi:MAG: Ig-like domain-containing protein [Desulfuromonadales bacterium]